MALLYLFTALVIQGSFSNANSTEEVQIDSQEIFNVTEVNDEVFKDESKEDINDTLILRDAPLYPIFSAAMMEQATNNSEKSAEEQIEDIQEVADKITLAIRSEMANLLSYALAIGEKKNEDENQDENNLRKKRSTETPMDSSQLIVRLLKHIRNNNEYQNIAIEKMMTAQEIADKYGIEYRPDTEILSDLAFAANQNAKDMTLLLNDACNMKNHIKEMSPMERLMIEEPTENKPYYFYADHFPDQHMMNNEGHSNSQPELNHSHYSDSYPNLNNYYNYPYETQIPSPVQNYYSPPVNKNPNFYDAVSQDFYPYCSMEPMSSPVRPREETVESEPELVGEECEETITSKVLVDRGDEPGSATVNHVMTYTVSEKSHFRTPEIERLPQQMQHCFFLM